MQYLEEMLLRNGLILTNPDGSTSRIEGSLLTNTLCVCDSSGRVTHRIERATLSNDLIIRNTSTNQIEGRLQAPLLAA